MDDSIHAFDVGERDQPPSSTPRLDKASLDGIYGAQLPPWAAWKLEKRQQRGQILH